jgi:hypothetical protein
MMGLMIQMHHANGWGGPEGYLAPHVLDQHDEGQPEGLAPLDPRDEISLARPEHVFSDARDLGKYLFILNIYNYFNTHVRI